VNSEAGSVRRLAVPVKAKYGSDSEYFDLDVSELRILM
jgi:hypothetical protein